MLRNGMNYEEGLDGDGSIDHGMIFVAYQRSLEASFFAVQRRLDGEPLERFVTPFGGGYFYVLPGAGGGYLGESLLGTVGA